MQNVGEALMDIDGDCDDEEENEDDENGDVDEDSKNNSVLENEQEKKEEETSPRGVIVEVSKRGRKKRKTLYNDFVST